MSPFPRAFYLIVHLQKVEIDCFQKVTWFFSGAFNLGSFLLDHFSYSKFEPQISSTELFTVPRRQRCHFHENIREFNERISSRPRPTFVGLGSSSGQRSRAARQLLPRFPQDDPSVLFLVAELDKSTEPKASFQVQSVPEIHYFKGVQDGKPSQIVQIGGAQIPHIKAKIASLVTVDRFPRPARNLEDC
jgi:hypothetical protein